MAFFKVTLETISEVGPAENSDNLDLVKLKGLGFQFIVGRGSMQPGQQVVYFPIDSLLPENVKAVFPEVITNKLKGKEHNRITTAKLRGNISQGLAYEVEKFPWANFKLYYKEGKIFEESGIEVPDITIPLGVTKYEPPIINIGAFRLHQLPPDSPYYDIEGADRFPNILEMLMDVQIVATEKLEGTNHSVLIDFPGALTHVCQRKHEIIPELGSINIYHNAAQQEKLLEKGTLISGGLQKSVTIRSEMIGGNIQGNYYGLKQHELHTFEVWIAGRPINYPQQVELTDKFKIRVVPVLFIGKLRDYLNGKTLQEISNGMSRINPQRLREGVVIRPLVELPEVQGFGRVIIKMRSPEYLAKTGN